MSDLGLRAVSAIGFVALLGVAFALSSDRRHVAWRTIGWATGMQLALGFLLLRSEPGRLFFVGVNAAIVRLLETTGEGSRFLFGALMDPGFSFVTGVLPVIVFMGSLLGVLHHYGIVQWVVRWIARLLSRTLGLSGAESLAAATNVFVGMVEAGLAVRPYLAGMTRSELFSVMSVGMATVSGSVLVAYVGMLGGGDFAGHLVTASLLSAPAALAIAKLMVPETETPMSSAAGAELPRAEPEEDPSENAVDAAARGALAGVQLAIAVGAMLLAFVALVALVNGVLAGIGSWFGWPDLTLQTILGWLVTPLAVAMGVPWEDARSVASLIGIKTVLNEFVAYQELGSQIASGAIQERSAIIVSYALCGFANFASLGILLGGLGGIAPSRRPEMARLGLRSIVAGTLATCMTGCVAGLLLA